MKKSFFFGLILIIFFAIWPVSSWAAIPFGGRITSVIPCTCNWMLGDLSVCVEQLPVAGPPFLIFTAGVSRLYSYFQLLPGSWILGNTYPMVSSCWVGVIPFCVPVDGCALAPIISIVGTSGVGMTAGSGL